MGELIQKAEKLANVWVWSAALSRVLLAAAPVVAVTAFALGGVSVSIEGGAV